ncbi:hypothetical protein C2E23DRAFT_887900 [Lenzites betulinus]|nr:hypothetical protein C2E23DRAFT_887900 [Lenzites betulinus]
MSEPTKMYEPYGSGRVGVVEPFIYGPRMARLLARTTDGGGSTDTSSSTSTSSGGKHAINPVALAFIAVAVFVVCTLVIFKGVRALRGHGVVPVYRKPVENGDGSEKPRMWEVHLNQPAAPPCAPAGDG